MVVMTGGAQEIWEARGERMADAFVAREITEGEYREFLQRHLASRSPDDPEIDSIIDALRQDRENTNE